MDFSLQRALRAQVEGKALGAHPAFMDPNTPVSIYAPGANRQDAKLTQRSALRHESAYGGLQAIDHVYDCIGLYTDPIATSPYALRKPDGTPMVRHKNTGTPPEHEVGPAALYELLDKPNPHMLYDELMTLLVIDLLLVGNAYWMKWRTNAAGQPLALYRLSPGYVKVIPGAFGPKSYEYQPPGAKDPIALAVEEVVHFRRPNPADAYYGMGVIQGAGRAMDLELAVTDTIASYYENQAAPSMIVQSERRVPREVFKKLAAQLRNRVSGSGRAGELLVLEAGLKASSLSASAADALFKDLMAMSRDRVYSKFRAAPELFGQSSGTGSNKVSDFRREFDNATLRPFMDKLQRVVSDTIAAAYGAELVIEYRHTAPPEEAIKIGESVAAIPGVLVREVRKQYAQFGIPESTGDPEIDNLVINVPGQNLDANGQNGMADQPLGSEAGRPPKPSNTTAFAKVRPKAAGKALTVAERLQLAEDKARLFEVSPEGKALKNADGSNATIGSKLQGEQRPPDPFADARDADVTAAQGYIQTQLADAAKTLERALLDHVEGKALRNQGDLIKRIRASEAWKVFKQQVDDILMEGARRAVSASVMTSANAGRIPDEELDYDEIAASVVRRPEGVRTIVKTLKDRVAMRLSRALAKEDVIPGVIQGEVQTVIREWSNNQASMIGETESVHAYNEATLTIAEMTGATQVFVTDGHDDDEPCIEADGSVWDIDYARLNRLEHPRCRRAFIPLTADG
jgi:HK97 family phage portal protein